MRASQNPSWHIYRPTVINNIIRLPPAVIIYVQHNRRQICATLKVEIVS